MNFSEVMDLARRDAADQRRVREKEAHARVVEKPEVKLRLERVALARERLKLFEGDELRLLLENAINKIRDLKDEVFGGPVHRQDEPDYRNEGVVMKEYVDQVWQTLDDVHDLLCIAQSGTSDRMAALNVANEDGTMFGEEVDEDAS